MRLHHATAKRAEENGVTMEHADDVWVATKGEARWTDEHAPVALDAAIFDARARAEYPALTLARIDGKWAVLGGDDNHHLWPVTSDGEAIFASAPPKPADLAEIVDYAVELGIDPAEGYDEDEDERPGSVVAPHYKRQYAEDGHPNNNGDWLNQMFAELKLVVAEGKKTRTDVQGLNTLFAENGIISEDHAFGGAFHGTAPRKNGWQGRFRMSGGNMLRPRIANAGVLIAFGEKIKVPEDFIAKHRTKPRATKKAAKTEDEAKGA